MKTVLYWGGIVGIWLLILLAALVLVFSRGLPNISNLDAINSQPSISYLDRSGGLIGVRGTVQTDLVSLDQLPPYVPKAFITTEDQWFWWHPGFNPWGILRSGVYDVLHRGKGGPLRGGSTITQQVARNLFGLGRQQKMTRKIQELILAVELEIRYSKKQILTVYLNHMDFGGGATGIEAASERYFGHPASQLSVGETALLAGVLKGTSTYNPAYNPQAAAKRATGIILAMAKRHDITKAQRDAALDPKNGVLTSRNPANQHAAYFIDWLNDQVLSAIGGQLTENLVVQTTLDLGLQGAAEGAISQGVRDNAKVGVTQAALISLDGEGRIRAYVGGPNYNETPFDRISNGHRQPGSSFKPFVYLAAMESGKTPNMIEVDEPVTIDGWSPSNYEPGNRGPMTLQNALAESVNTIAAKVTQEVGVDKVIEVAHRLGVKSAIPAVPSIALGTGEVTPLEMAQAYAAFSNGGYRVQAYGIETIRSAKTGKVLYDRSRDPAAPQQVIGSPALQYMNQMMRQVVAGGTGTAAGVAGYDIAGKTGTTSDWHDAWFDGFTGGFTTVVWMANDEGKNMHGVTGGQGPAKTWHAYMAQALPRLQKEDIPGGTIDPPPVEAPSNPVGAVVDGIGDLISRVIGGGAGPPAPPAPRPAPQPPAAPAAQRAQDLPY